MQAVAPSALSWVALNQHWEQQVRSRLPSSQLSAGNQPLVHGQQADPQSGMNSLFCLFHALAESNIIAIVDVQRSDAISLLLSMWRALVVETTRPIFFLDPAIAQQALTVPALADYWLGRLASKIAVDPKALVSETVLTSSYLLIDSFDSFPEAAKAAWLSTFPRVHQVIMTSSTYDERLDRIGGQALYLSREPFAK
jgi:hypothetical protein